MNRIKIKLLLVACFSPCAVLAQVPEQEPVVNMAEVIFGEPQTYADISDTDRTRQAAVASLSERCVSWKKEVADSVKDKVNFLELDCDSDRIKVNVERFGSGDRKTIQASVVAQLKLGPKYGYLLIPDAIRGWFGEDRQNIVLAALKSYDERCKTWKKQTQEKFGKSFIYANCGKTREIQAISLPEASYIQQNGESIRQADPPHIIPGTRVASQGQILILLEDMYQAEFNIPVGPTERVACGPDPKAGRTNAENLYWAACQNFRIEQRNKYGARLIYASCEPYLGSDLITGSSQGRWLWGRGVDYTCQGFIAKTKGSIWILK